MHCQFVFLFFLPVSGNAAINWSKFRENAGHEITASFPYIKCFERSAKKHNVPLLLLLSVAKGESNFNPGAVSNKGAVGIMQILWPGTAKDLGFKTRKELFDPCRNIDAGTRYMAWLLQKYDGDIYLALAAYFSGHSRVKKGMVPDYGDDYSRYIYSKLTEIKGVPYKQRIYIVVMAYDRYLFADNFITYIHKKDPSIPLEITKDALNQYVINIAVDTSKEKKDSIKKIEKITGLSI